MMIMVLAGTQDGREIVAQLLKKDYAVLASVVSTYGEELLASTKGGKLIINDKPLDATQMAACFKEHAIKLVVDASHPYAVNVSQNAMQVCKTASIPYIRYERDITKLKYEKVHIVYSYDEAANLAAKLGKRIFLTTGSRNLHQFANAEVLKACELIVRVLPTAEVIALCEQQGINAGHIVAMQGPFSMELNKELFLKYQADVIITKNSGTLGGTDTKLMAAQSLGLPVIVIDRPQLNYLNIGRSYEEILTFVKEHC